MFEWNSVFMYSLAAIVRYRRLNEYKINDSFCLLLEPAPYAARCDSITHNPYGCIFF